MVSGVLILKHFRVFAYLKLTTSVNRHVIVMLSLRFMQISSIISNRSHFPRYLCRHLNWSACLLVIKRLASPCLICSGKILRHHNRVWEFNFHMKISYHSSGLEDYFK